MKNLREKIRGKTLKVVRNGSSKAPREECEEDSRRDQVMRSHVGEISDLPHTKEDMEEENEFHDAQETIPSEIREKTSKKEVLASQRSRISETTMLGILEKVNAMMNVESNYEYKEEIAD
ncbi:hypothetical protein KI387_005483, partial [Taxus chinensis]